MKIVFSSHLIEKIKILNSHGFKTDKSIIIEAIENPDLVLDGYAGRLVIQKKYDNEHLIRIVIEKRENYIKVVTVYPARRKRYENKI